MLVNSAAAMRAPQWYTSPRTSAIGTPRLTVILVTELMKVRAYTNSCNTSVKVNTITVKIPGTISRGATFTITPSRLRPSIIACSSTSHGTDRRNPMTSQVQNGIVMVGETRMSAPSESWRWSNEMSREDGTNRSVGGIRYVKNIPVPRRSPQRPTRRARLYPAGTATATVITATATTTTSVFRTHRGKSV